MDSNEFIDTVINGDWSAKYELSKCFKKLTAQEKEKIADNLIEQLKKRSEQRNLSILRFFRGHLHLHYLQESSIAKLIKRLQLLTSRKSSSNEVLECIAGIFHTHVPDSCAASAAKLLLDLSNNTNEIVRSSAVRNLGNMKKPLGSKGLNSVLFDRVLNAWRDPNEGIAVKVSALHTLYNFTLDLKDDKLRYIISEIVIEALESPISEFRHGALWILNGGNLGWGFKVHHNFTGRVFELLLQALKENRDIPKSWYLAAFKVTPGILPEWAAVKLSELKAEEKEERERHEELQHKFEFRERKKEEISNYEYHVALSFAGEDRKFAQRFAELLNEKDINIFYDQYEQAELWGKDLYQHLQSIYRDKAQFCVVFLSRDYAKKLWTRHELEQAQARAFMENREYILPIRIDDTTIPGINETIGYIDLRLTTIEMIAEMFIKKLST